MFHAKRLPLILYSSRPSSRFPLLQLSEGISQLIRQSVKTQSENGPAKLIIMELT